MTAIGVNRIHWPVTVLGPGNRIGIWVQGCSIECPGCIARDTWPSMDEQEKVRVGELLDRIKGLVEDCPPGAVDGVTISGGEPFDQVEALEELLLALRPVLKGMGSPNADLLVYTGYEEDEARRRGPGIFSLADGLIVGPYRAAEPGHSWWGSANQRLIVRHQSFALRYESALRNYRPAMQVSVEGGQVFLIGVPGRKTLSSVEKRLKSAGIKMEGVSWKP